MSKKKSPKELTKKAKKQSDRISNPHDSFFQRVFSENEHARELIEGFVPEQIVAKFKLDEMAPEKDIYTDEGLKRHMTDLLFEVPLRVAQSGSDSEKGAAKKSAIIYCLFEHKSKPETTIQEQILRYMNERWQLDRANGIERRLIIPIVFYHGAERWTIPIRFADSFENVDPVLHEFIPNFRYILIDTSTYGKEEIQQRIRSRALQACLLLLKYIYDKDLAEKLVMILSLLVKSNLPTERVKSLLESMLKYMTSTKNRVSDEVVNQALATVFADEEEMMESIIDRWIEQGRQEARQTLELEMEKRIKLEREKTRQEDLKNRRKTILQILNYGLELNEHDTASITNRLAKIENKAELEKLINAALDATKKGIASFMAQLPPESKTDVK